MKYNSIFKILTFAFVCAMLATSCVKEGPMGPAGADGINGVDGANGADGNVTCLECHDGPNMLEKQGQFWMSEHSVGAIAVDYAGSRAGCAPCHSHELFVQSATADGIDPSAVAGDITNPSAWECSTCHAIHEDFEGSQDFALRSSDPVVPYFDKSTTMDLSGSSNLCAVCHQSRRPEPNIDKPGDEYKITSTHYGPHHGAQANVVAGVGFAEIEGSISYPTGANKHLEMASCTGCHMTTFAENDFEDEDGEVDQFAQGGHSFIPSMKACNDCHGTTDTNFNYGGVQTEVHEMLVELRDLLVEAGVVEGDEVDGFHPHVGTYPMVQVQAFFNWVGLEEDRSMGVHNPKYVKALLMNSIEAMEAELALASN